MNHCENRTVPWKTARTDAAGAAEIFTPQFVGWMFHGFSAEQMALCVSLTRILLPAQIFFYVGGVVGAVLLSHRMFLFPSFGPLIYNLFIILLGPAIALGFWFALQRTRAGRFIRAAALDRETLGALGVNVKALYTGVFVLASFLGGLGGALITPMRAIVPGMDTEVIVEAFVVVVIGGLGSFWGTFLGALIYGQVLSFGILFFPRFSIFSIFALMAAVLIIRPWGLLGRPLK